MTPPVFYREVTGVAVGDTVVLDGPEGRHAADARRLRPGEVIDLTDGAGTVLRSTVTQVRRGEVVVEVDERSVAPRPEPSLGVVQALARGGRDEQAVEAMTEVGVDQIVGWEAARNVARWTDRTHAKWSTTARSAAKQSRRAWWPEVSGPESTSDVAARCAAADVALVLHEAAGRPLAAVDLATAGSIVVVVGPEGGITDAELASLADAGGHSVRLGQTVLRSSTAGVAALSVICAATRWR